MRVSTQEQMRDGYGLEAQENNLRDYIESNRVLGFDESEIRFFKDIHTGSVLNRPDLTKLIEEIKAGHVSAVIVWKIDRLSRSLKHLIHLVEIMEQHGVAFISVQENMDFRGAIGKLVFNFFASIAEFERSLIRGRTHQGKIASAEMGNFTGAVAPYGYSKIRNSGRKGSKLVIDERQAKWVDQIYQWYVSEEIGPEAIVKKLQSDLGAFDGESARKHKSHPTKWTIEIVTGILTNPIYRGEYVANKKDENGNLLPVEKWTILKTPAIIEPLFWFQAQEARRSRKAAHGTYEYLLRGLIYDQTMGGRKRFSGVSRTKGGHSYRRKKTVDANGQVFPAFEIPAKQLEEYVWGLVKSAIREPLRFFEEYTKNRSQPRQDVEQLAAIKNQIAAIESQEIPRIQSAYEKGIYSEEDTAKRLQEKEEKLAVLRISVEEQDTLVEIEEEDRKIQKNLNAISEKLKHKIENLTRSEKRILVSLFVNSIWLWRDPRNPKGEIKGWISLNFDDHYLGRIGRSGRTHQTNAEAGIERKIPETCPGGQLAHTRSQKQSEVTTVREEMVFEFRIVKQPKSVERTVFSIRKAN
ncbi:MAG: recombinase family protein [Verrucomicrobiota bacterium]